MQTIFVQRIHALDVKMQEVACKDIEHILVIWNQDEDPLKIQIIYGTLHLTFDYNSKGSMNNGGMTKLLEPNIYLRSL